MTRTKAQRKTLVGYIGAGVFFAIFGGGAVVAAVGLAVTGWQAGFPWFAFIEGGVVVGAIVAWLYIRGGKE